MNAPQQSRVTRAEQTRRHVRVVLLLSCILAIVALAAPLAAAQPRGLIFRRGRSRWPARGPAATAPRTSSCCREA